MKNSLESLRAEAERQKARAEGLAEQVAALTKESNRQSARIMELNGIIKHIRLSEAGKRGSLMKRYNTLLTEYQDLADQLALIEERCAATQKENIESKLLVSRLQEQNKRLILRRDQLTEDRNDFANKLKEAKDELERVRNEKEIVEWKREYLTTMCAELENRLKRHGKALVKLMSRNLWQRIINKPVTISGKAETTEGHEQKPEVPTTAEQ